MLKNLLMTKGFGFKVQYSSMRMNHANMDWKRVMYFMISFFVCFVFVASSSVESKLKTEEGKQIEFSELNPRVVELIWTNCRQELIHVKDGVKEVELFVPEEQCKTRNEILLKSRSENNVDVEKVLNVCDPQIQQTILHCLKEKNIMFPQICELNQGCRITPSVPSPSSDSEVPNFDPNYSGVKPTVRHLSETQSPPKEKNVQKKKPKMKKKVDPMNIVIAFVVLLSMLLCIVGICLLCCCKALKTSSGAKKDDRPLLSVSLSDYSSASSKSYYNRTSSTKKKGNQSFGNASNNEQFSDEFYKPNSLKIALEVHKGTEIGSPTAVSGTAGPHNLKPPPGRAGLGKPPSGKSARPPPPPPDVSDSPQPPPPPVPTNAPSGSPAPAPAPPPPPGMKNGPPPPPPLRTGGPPPPPLGLKPRASPARPGQKSTNDDADGGADASKTKLKPFFWDKVPTNPDDSMVWNQIKAGSFQFNEEMIETLFGYAPAEKSKGSKKLSTAQDANESIQIIEPKKAQNLAILLKALNVTTEEVCDALQEGNELPAGLLQTLLKMAPTPEEELKLRLYDGDVTRLGNAERFLKVVIEIPFAFMRLESLLFMCCLQEEETIVRESFTTLEAACTNLRKNRLFLKLLEAVLKTGNRMNDGTFRGGAQAFKLDTLLKLSDVKGKDGKTTLLHFVVQEIIRTEGMKAYRATRDRRSFSSINSDDLLEDSSEDSEDHYRELGLEVVSNIGKDLESVKRAAILDSDGLTGTVAKFGNSLVKAKNFLNSEMKDVDEDNGFYKALKGFVKEAEVGIMQMLEEEKRIMALVKSTADYFHGTAGKEEGLRIFVIVRDFLVLLDKVCREIKVTTKRSLKNIKREDSAKSTQSQTPSSDPRQKLAPKITERRMDSSSSDEDT